MPIRPELRPLYPADWRELSRKVRFERAGGRCQRCGRRHGEIIRVLPDGRWFDVRTKTWRNGRGRPARWPDLEEAIRLRETRVVLAAAHLDHDPRHNRLRGGLVPSYTIIIRECFPAKEAGSRVGIVMMATLFGMALGGWMSGVIFDFTGSYQAAFANGVVWNIANATIAVWLLLRARWQSVPLGQRVAFRS